MYNIHEIKKEGNSWQTKKRTPPNKAAAEPPVWETAAGAPGNGVVSADQIKKLMAEYRIGDKTMNEVKAELGIKPYRKMRLGKSVRRR